MNVPEFIRKIPESTAAIIIFYFLFVNLAAFLAMALDKHKARKGAFRIPEAVLFLFSVIGGSIGSLLGMFLFHHKTRKWKFRSGMPAILIIQIAVIAWLVLFSGVELR